MWGGGDIQRWGWGGGAVVKLLLFVWGFFFRLRKLHKMYYFGTMDQVFLFSFSFLVLSVNCCSQRTPITARFFYPVLKIDKTHYYYSSNAIFISQKDVDFVPCKPSSFCTLHMEAYIPIPAFKQDNAIMQPSMHVLTLLRMANSSHKAQKSHCISLK